MPNHYDKILRENIEAILLPISKKYFGFEIAEVKDLPSTLQVTTGREPDFVKHVKTVAGEEFILHLEYQTNNDPRMIFRMQTYHALLMELYGKEVRQFVIYLGKSKVNMRNKLIRAEIIDGFTIKDVSQFDYGELLKSTIPEEIILAILSDFKGNDPIAVIRLIFQRLIKVGESESAVRKAMKQLGMLSRLRKLEEAVIEESKNMPITYDITQDKYYKQGEARGEARGILKTKIDTALTMLKAGKYLVSEIAVITGLSKKKVEELKNLSSYTKE